MDLLFGLKSWHASFWRYDFWRDVHVTKANWDIGVYLKIVPSAIVF